ncbi:MAG: hypothetical protein K9L17_11465 [Clostridiales bacterium]|nr:hypothetical protein [Clostridiales bacterium]MCF8023300.1 hypothetical protein [Clostridiales bacterium]
MQPNPYFLGKSSEFWAHVMLVSEQLGYSNKNNGVISHTSKEIIKKLHEFGLEPNPELINEVVAYLDYRANLLNNCVKDFLMDVEPARRVFCDLLRQYKKQGLTCSLPLNKQKGEKKDYAYFTCMVNIIAEQTLRRYCAENGLSYGPKGDIYFNDDPRTLSFNVNGDSHLISVFSRRFDGAFPGIRNPVAVWEIKEYYYTTTFGSRIADGVYETQLDGFEIRLFRENNPEGHNVKHIYFVDSYTTWWLMGKSYLCRIVDMMHKQLVDEVIFGYEVFERWHELIYEILSDI